MNYRTCQFRSTVGINIKFTLRTISDMKYTYNTHPSLWGFQHPTLNLSIHQITTSQVLSRQPLTKPLSSISVAVTI